jgi:hypothetical protein
MSGSKEIKGGGSGDSGLPRVLDYGLQGTVYYRAVRAPERCLPRSNLRRSVVNVNVCAWRVMGAFGYWVMVWVKEWCAGLGMSLRNSQHYPPESRIWKLTNISPIWKAGQRVMPDRRRLLFFTQANLL